MTQRKFRCTLLISTGVIGILSLSLVGLFSYTPNTSVPFPYIMPPEGDQGYYLQTKAEILNTAFTSIYADPEVAEDLYKGESFIFKNVVIEEWMLQKTLLYYNGVHFLPKDHLSFFKLKAGDVVDIIGVCAGLSKKWGTIVVISNCHFLPPGLAPLPLPGGPAPIPDY